MPAQRLLSYPVWDVATRSFHWVNLVCVFALAAIGTGILFEKELGDRQRQNPFEDYPRLVRLRLRCQLGLAPDLDLHWQSARKVVCYPSVPIWLRSSIQELSA